MPNDPCIICDALDTKMTPLGPLCPACDCAMVAVCVEDQNKKVIMTRPAPGVN